MLGDLPPEAKALLASKAPAAAANGPREPPIASTFRAMGALPKRPPGTAYDDPRNGREWT